LFGDTHIPLKKWFMAIAMICQAKKGISANQLGRDIGVSTKTAWYLCHRIRESMTDVNPEPMDGLEYEMDETYVGGRYRGPDPTRFHAKNKEIVVGIKQRGGDVRFFHVQDVKSSTLARYIKGNVSPEATLICTDEHTSYPGAVKLSGLRELQHETVNHTAREYVRGNITTNSIEGTFSLFKRGLVGSYHRLSVKHLHRYLHEFQFRANNRHNPVIFQDVLRNVASKPRLPLRTLIDGQGAELPNLA
jgi:transposase-like protein